MTVKVSHEGYVCSDCLMVIANADFSGIQDPDAWSERVIKHNPTEDGKYNVVPTGDDDPRLSDLGCDFCNDRTLGMTVHHVSFLEESK